MRAEKQFAPGLSGGSKIKQTQTCGCPLVTETLRERPGNKKLTEIIKEKGMRIDCEHALLPMTANRLREPESRLGVRDHRLSAVRMPACSGLELNHI